MTKRIIIILFLIVGTTASLWYFFKNDYLPKPPSYLKLEYPVQEYDPYKNNCFEINHNVISTPKLKNLCDLELVYPSMKATIHLTHKTIDNNLIQLIRDAQNITYKHVVKADEISEVPYINKNRKVYGMLYDVGGNAASNSQFYVTDSVKHFVTGSVYFYSKPNYDSIYPALHYIKDDLIKIMESIEWNN